MILVFIFNRGGWFLVGYSGSRDGLDYTPHAIYIYYRYLAKKTGVGVANSKLNHKKNRVLVLVAGWLPDCLTA